MNKNSRETLIYRIGIISTILSGVLFFGIILCELYIRWKINQDFTLLGNLELPALAMLLLGLIAVLSFTHKSER